MLTTKQQRDDDCRVHLPPISPLLWIVKQVRERRRVRVLVHRGIFLLPESPEYYFIKMTNLSRNREIQITHIWFDTEPRAHLLNPARPLEARLRPDETFEICVLVAEVPNAPNVEWLGRVRLSSGKTIKSQLNNKVPPVGHMAGSQPLIMRVVLAGAAQAAT
jgi:hypothetical protein